MRPCKGFAETSSRDDVISGEQSLEESGDDQDLIFYISALVRSEREADVLKGLDLIENITVELDEDKKTSVEFLAVLAYYRLKKDQECIKRAREAEAKGCATKETLEILRRVLKMKKNEQKRDIGVAFGIGVGVAALVGGVLGALFGGSRRK